MRRLVLPLLVGAWLVALLGCPGGEGTQTPDTSTKPPKGGLQRTTAPAPPPPPLPGKP